MYSSCRYHENVGATGDGSMVQSEQFSPAWHQQQQQQRSCAMMEKQQPSLPAYSSHPWRHYEMSHHVSMNGSCESVYHHHHHQQQQLNHDATRSSMATVDNISRYHDVFQYCSLPATVWNAFITITVLNFSFAMIAHLSRICIAINKRLKFSRSR